MSGWKILYFIIGGIVLVAGIQEVKWIEIIIGIIFLFLGVIAK